MVFILPYFDRKINGWYAMCRCEHFLKIFMSRESRDPSFDSMEQWMGALPDKHNPLPDQNKKEREAKALQMRVESLSHQKWGNPNPENIAFERAVEDGYLSANGKLTEEGLKLLKKELTQQGRGREKKMLERKTALGRKKAESGEKQPSPADRIIWVFTSHGFEIGKDSFSLAINDRAIKSSTPNYRLTFYGRPNSAGVKHLVQIFEGTLDQIAERVDDQAVDLVSRMRGLESRRRTRVAPEDDNASPEMSID